CFHGAPSAPASPWPGHGDDIRPPEVHSSTPSTDSGLFYLLPSVQNQGCEKPPRSGGTMKFTITRQNLHNGLVAVSAAVPSKTTLPVLSNILFDADADGIRMSGTDLDVAVRVRVPADVAEPGSLTAPGKKLQEI